MNFFAVVKPIQALTAMSLHSQSALHHYVYIASAPRYPELVTVLDYS